MTKRPLKRFGSYALLARLAKGGMGEVFVARHGDLAGMQKLCVVKTLRADMSRDDEYEARFFDEARLVVQLSHRNVCQVFDVGRVGDRFYLGMELIAGIDLRALIDESHARDAGVPEPLALFIVIEMLEALSYAHRRKDPTTGASLHIVHRDVSPQNVMVSFEGEVKLIDFGLAASTLKQERTQVNRVMGKLHYMSPEQARGGDVDERADIFAAAVVAYELLTGHRYYEGMTHDEVWNVAGRGTYRAPRLGALHKGLVRVLEGALAPRVDERTATAEAFREGLEAYLFARGFRPSPADLRSYLAERLVDAKRLHEALLAEAAGVVDDEGTPVEESRSLVRAPRSSEDVSATDDTKRTDRTPAAARSTSTTDERSPPVAVKAVVPHDDAAHDDAPAPRGDGHAAAEHGDDVLPHVVEARPSVSLSDRGAVTRPSVALVVGVVVAALFGLVLVATATVALLGDDERPPAVAVAPPVRPVEPATSDAESDPAPSPSIDGAVDAGLEPEASEPARPTTSAVKKKRVNKRRTPRPPPRTASAEVKLSFLKKHCLDVPCTTTALAIKPRTTWTTKDRFRYDNILSSCVALCTE